MLVTFYELNPLPDEVIHHHTRVFSCPAVVQVFWENKNIKKYKTYEVPQHIKITQLSVCTLQQIFLFKQGCQG